MPQGIDARSARDGPCLKTAAGGLTLDMTALRAPTVPPPEVCPVFARLHTSVSIRATARLAGLALAAIGAVGAFGAPSAVGATAFLTSLSPGYHATAVDLAAGTSSWIANPNGSTQVAITPDGATAYVTSTDSGKVTPIDVATGSPGTPIAVGGYPYGIAIAPDGATAYVTDLIGNAVTPITWRRRPPKPRSPVSAPARPSSSRPTGTLLTWRPGRTTR